MRTASILPRLQLGQHNVWRIITYRMTKVDERIVIINSHQHTELHLSFSLSVKDYLQFPGIFIVCESELQLFATTSCLLLREREILFNESVFITYIVYHALRGRGAEHGSVRWDTPFDSTRTHSSSESIHCRLLLLVNH